MSNMHQQTKLTANLLNQLEESLKNALKEGEGGEVFIKVNQKGLSIENLVPTGRRFRFTLDATVHVKKEKTEA